MHRKPIYIDTKDKNNGLIDGRKVKLANDTIELEFSWDKKELNAFIRSIEVDN
jgi:hypothetical protein